MDELELKNFLIKMVQVYGTTWNEHETYVRTQSDAQEEEMKAKFANDVDKFAWQKVKPPVDWFDEFTKLLAPLFDKYVTEKKRVYGGSVRRSFGFPSKFNGIENPIETNVELKNKNRAEVYFKTETKFKDEYLFVLLRKSDEWRIDSYKGRRYGNEKWDNQIL